MPEEVVDEGVLFESGRPVIFVPFIQTAALKLDRVMVCWDGSRAATRAIADAMPFLEKAKQVEVVVIGNKPAKSDELSGADLGQHLARHGMKVEVKRITSPDIDVPSTILSYAADCVHRHDRDGRLRPFAPARIRARRRHPRHSGIDDGAGADVALSDIGHCGHARVSGRARNPHAHSVHVSGFRVRARRARPGMTRMRMLERHVTLLDGDAGAVPAAQAGRRRALSRFSTEVTPDDLRLRFFAAMREVSHDMIDKLIHYDPAHAMAFIAIEQRSGKMLGVVRLHDEPNGKDGEFAILVRSHLKGHGLGWLMMKHMIAYAKEKGLKTVQRRGAGGELHHAR